MPCAAVSDERSREVSQYSRNDDTIAYRPASREIMPAYVIFDVEIRDAERCQDFMNQVKPALAAAGQTLGVKGGRHY